MKSIFVLLIACSAVAQATECQADETTMLQGRASVARQQKRMKATDAKSLDVKSFSTAPQLCDGDSPCEPAAAAAAAAEAAAMAAQASKAAAIAAADMAAQASKAAAIAAADAVGVWPLTGQPSNTGTSETAAAAVCPSSWVQIGGAGANIDGCGLQSCDARYEAESEAACAASCDTHIDCDGFSFAPMNGDEDHQTTTVCTLYSSVKPTGKHGAVQVFCAKKEPEPTLPPPEWFLPVDWTIEASSTRNMNHVADNVKVVGGDPWLSSGELPAHLILDAGEVVNLNAFATVHPRIFLGCAFQDYSLLVSDDGSEFTELQAGRGDDLGLNERQDIDFPATASRYWKLIMTSNHGRGPPPYITIQYLEWRSSR